MGYPVCSNRIHSSGINGPWKSLFETTKSFLGDGHRLKLFLGVWESGALPTPYNDVNSLKIEMWNLNGTITTPWFDQEYVKDYYQESKEFLVVLRLPGDIKYNIAKGTTDPRVEFYLPK